MKKKQLTPAASDIATNNMAEEKDLFDDSNFGEETEVASSTIDWGKSGDYFVGTFLKARHGVETQFGSNSIYEFLAEKGQYHKLTKKKPADEPTLINKGDNIAVWGRGDIFCGQCNSLRPGQIIKMMYVEDKETKMGQSKIVKIYAPKENDGSPKMNQIWLDQQGVTGGDL